MNDAIHPYASSLVRRMWAALDGPPGAVERVRFSGDKIMPSCFAMTDLGAAAVATAGAAVAELVGTARGTSAGTGQRAPLAVTVDRTLSAGWFHRATRPLVPRQAQRSPFHAMSQDFPTADGRWLRFQANYPHLRRAALDVLGLGPDPSGAEIAAVVRAHAADELEAAVVAGGGAAAATRTVEEWRAHPQGVAVAAEPLVGVERSPVGSPDPAAGGWEPLPARPLAGLRVLDLTRVLAGPMATRFLAGYGAQVLRIDPPGYVEPTGVGTGDLTLGKRCAYLDLTSTSGRARFLELLAGADVLVHGLRPGALDGLGLGRRERAQVRPDLVEVTLDAYGWTGPWAHRRGFDTLVQASTGMALAGGRWADKDGPHRWPVSILDHATGYLMAAAVVRAITERKVGGGGSMTRMSLAGVADLLVSEGEGPADPALTLPLDGPFAEHVQSSPLGPVRRLVWPMTVAGAAFGWDRPGDPYGSSSPEWVDPA